MALCLAPTLEFENVDHATQSKFLALIHDIYQSTYQNEEHCSTYCWFRDINNPQFVQGFEFYDNEDALAVTHRGSAPYKKMRQFIAGLQETDSGLFKFPQLQLLTPVEGFVDGSNNDLHFEHRACRFRVITIKLCTDHESSKGTATRFTTSLKSLVQDLDRTRTALACHTAAAVESGRRDRQEPSSELSTTLHFLFVECYSSEEGCLTQRDQNQLRL
ncbi:hypothetical protein ASPVEDRAFT_87782 [Aspergillus versicolor CBS 583.65]|uniref:ABM domain-containing protein n=1 Tax=Aspergillus versicolor CBS 583.65 TaxID=1036611 RepID=A0A1L9PY88_ASPVE|nr:uncharacterized protein ASPVEDRAFT_87782 [Aspergillus versicolor CBS 583.65]OJJ06484.1 hypothetical protein ASPVEDRAFT_87782 [Aspergillus versicolor CBS 583.65]